MQTEQPRSPFGLDKTFIYRPVSSEWLKEKVKELNNGELINSTELLNKALDEAQLRLETKLEGRFIKDSEVICTRMGSDFYCDYLFIFEDNELSNKHRYRREGVVAEYQKPLAMRVRDQFENLIFECADGFTLSDLDRTKDDLCYKNPTVQQRYQGFKMYHESTLPKSKTLKDRFKGNQGLYFIGKLSQRGNIQFAKSPYRFQTAAQTYEAANNLAERDLEHFVICRVIDIIGSPETRI